MPQAGRLRLPQVPACSLSQQLNLSPRREKRPSMDPPKCSNTSPPSVGGHSSHNWSLGPLLSLRESNASSQTLLHGAKLNTHHTVCTPCMCSCVCVCVCVSVHIHTGIGVSLGTSHITQPS